MQNTAFLLAFSKMNPQVSVFGVIVKLALVRQPFLTPSTIMAFVLALPLTQPTHWVIFLLGVSTMLTPPILPSLCTTSVPLFPVFPALALMFFLSSTSLPTILLLGLTESLVVCWKTLLLLFVPSSADFSICRSSPAEFLQTNIPPTDLCQTDGKKLSPVTSWITLPTMKSSPNASSGSFLNHLHPMP